LFSHKGSYVLFYQYYWGEQSDSYSYIFKPKVQVGIASSSDKQHFDLGGANTNYCSGDTFTSWTEGVRRSAANTIQSFFITFGLLLGTVIGIVAVAYFVMSKARPPPTVAETLLESNSKEESLIENDEKKLALIGANNDLVVV
jgi:hypothetical protein